MRNIRYKIFALILGVSLCFCACTKQVDSTDSTDVSENTSVVTTTPETTQEKVKYVKAKYDRLIYPPEVNLLAEFNYIDDYLKWFDYLQCSAFGAFLFLADIDDDGIVESILHFTSSHTATANLVFKVIDNKVEFIGGYTSGDDEPALKKYKNKDGKLFCTSTDQFSYNAGHALNNTLLRIDINNNKLTSDSLCEYNWYEPNDIEKYNDKNNPCHYDDYYLCKNNDRIEATEQEYNKFLKEYFADCEYLGEVFFASSKKSYIGDPYYLYEDIEQNPDEIKDKFRIAVYETWDNYNSNKSYFDKKFCSTLDKSNINITCCDEITTFINSETINKENFLKSGILYNYDGLMFDDLGQEAPAKINTLIFTKALDKNIICGLNIGSPIDAIYEKLGVPNATTYDGSNFIFYLNGYSVMFIGIDKIDYIGIAKMPDLDESYDYMLYDIVRMNYGKEYIDYTAIMEKYPDYCFYTSAMKYSLSYPNGIRITDDFIFASLNYYTFWYNTYFGDIGYTTGDDVLLKFSSFCNKYKSNDWINNSSNTLSAYMEKDCRYYNSRIYIRNNTTGATERIVTLEHFPSDLYWLSDDVFICNVYMFGPALYNYRTDELELYSKHDNLFESYKINRLKNEIEFYDEDNKLILSVAISEFIKGD